MQQDCSKGQKLGSTKETQKHTKEYILKQVSLEVSVYYSQGAIMLSVHNITPFLPSSEQNQGNLKTAHLQTIQDLDHIIIYMGTLQNLQ